MRLYKLLFAITMLLCVNVATASVVNGDFENGFNGWTVTTGYCCGDSATVAPFDIQNNGNVTNAAVFQVSSIKESLSQTIQLIDGSFSFSADIASVSTSNNADGGSFEVFINNVLIDSFYFGENFDDTKYGTLEYYVDTIAAGLYELRIDIFRNYNSSLTTPKQYIDNITITNVSAVPLPASIYLFISALGGLSFFRRKC